MTLSYDKIFNSFLGLVTDYNLMSADEADVYAQMTEWMHGALSKPFTRRLFSQLSFDDAVQVLTYTMNNSVSEEEDEDFVVDIVAKGMVVEWAEPQVKKTTLIAQMFGGKEQKLRVA